jgi:hypothetical protein
MEGDIMRDRFSIALSGLGLICAFFAAPIASAQHNATPRGPAQSASQTYYYFCVSEVKPPAPTYISPVVHRGVGARGENAAAAEADVNKSFGGFLAKKYGYAGTISCMNQPSRSWMEDYRKQRIDLLRSGGYQVVEADWTDTEARTPVAPSNPSSAAQPATAGAVIGGPPPYAVCWAQLGGYTPYVSAAFDAAKGDPNMLVPTFIEYLKQKYGYKGFAACDRLNSLAEAQSDLKKIVDNFRSVRFNNGSHQEVIETGWTYTATANDQAIQAAGTAYVPGTSLTFCVTPSSAQRVIYFSTVTPASATVTQGDREASFAAFLQKKYGYRTSTSCPDTNITTPGAAKDYVTYRQVKIADYRSSSYTVIETDWTYTPVTGGAPGTSVPAAPAPVAPAKPATPARPAAMPSAAAAVAPAQTPYAICWGDQYGLHPTAYFSAPFAAPVRNENAWSKAYSEVLRNQYKFAGGIHCPTLKSLAEAQQRLRLAEDRYRAHWKIIETGWKYE